MCCMKLNHLLTLLSCLSLSPLCFNFTTPLLSAVVLLLFFKKILVYLSLSSSLFLVFFCLTLTFNFSLLVIITLTPHSPPSATYPFVHHYFLLPLPLSDIRLRVRAEYLEHESALRSGVSSDKRQPLERQFELFSQANSLLRARDLGSIVCDIKFTELANLEAFWSDYLSGALLEALKGVFITDSLRNAAGSEGVRLLISVDQDDYEEGRRLLRAKKIMGGHPETH